MLSHCERNTIKMPEPKSHVVKRVRRVAMKTGRRKAQFTRRKVLKMLAVMEPQETTMETAAAAVAAAANSHSQEFLSTGRTGRRNALPDILSEHAAVSSGDLPARLEGLTTNDGAGTSGASSSAATAAEAGSSKQPDAVGS